MLPLAFNLGYAAANGIGRFSGWRYDLPADWIAYFYFGVGFAEILFWLARVSGFVFGHPNWSSGQADNTRKADGDKPERNFVLRSSPLRLIFALIGALPWIAESINPPARYLELEPVAFKPNWPMTNFRFQRANPGLWKSARSGHTSGPVVVSAHFRGQLRAGSATPWPSYALRNYPRLGFKLLNRDVREVVFPDKGVRIKNVQGFDVIVLGCQRENYIEARLLLFPNENLTYLSDRALEPCSP